MPQRTGSSSTSIVAGVPRSTRIGFFVRRCPSTDPKRKPPDGWPPPTHLLTCRGTRSTLSSSTPRRGCPSTAPSTGYARSTATNPGTTNCAPKPSIAAARPCTPTPRTIQGCKGDQHARQRTVSTQSFATDVSAKAGPAQRPISLGRENCAIPPVLWTPQLHKRLHAHRTLEIVQGSSTEKAEQSRFTGLLQSPLTDSNRRPPPYHGTSLATRRNPRQRFSLVWALLGALPFATSCHDLRPLGSIKAPFFVVCVGYDVGAIVRMTRRD